MSKRKKEDLPSCALTCLQDETVCTSDECRMWLNFEDDLNCSLIAIYTNGNMTLSQIAERLDLSVVRISQIEKQALNKLLKRIKI